MVDTNQQIKDNIRADTISKRNGVYTARRGYFYTFGGSADKFAERIKAAYPNAKIIEVNDHWTPFRGGASIANSSHWMVKFTME